MTRNYDDDCEGLFHRIHSQGSRFRFLAPRSAPDTRSLNFVDSELAAADEPICVAAGFDLKVNVRSQLFQIGNDLAGNDVQGFAVIV